MCGFWKSVFFLAHSPKTDREPTWQDKLIDWWLKVRLQGASLLIGGLGLSWLIVKLRGKDKYSSENRQRKSKQVKFSSLTEKDETKNNL